MENSLKALHTFCHLSYSYVIVSIVLVDENGDDERNPTKSARQQNVREKLRIKYNTVE